MSGEVFTMGILTLSTKLTDKNQPSINPTRFQKVAQLAVNPTVFKFSAIHREAHQK